MTAGLKTRGEKNEGLTIVDHLDELRLRMVKSVIFLGAAFFTACFFSKSLITFIIKPIGHLIFIAPQDAFIANVKVAFFAALFFSSPFLVFQIWEFVAAALTEKEKRYIIFFGPLSFLFFIAGAIFAYFVIIPIGLDFLLGFSTENLSAAISVNNYISFIGTLVLSFGIVFELPIAVLFLTKLGIVDHVYLSAKRRHAVVAIFIIAAILTPPDVVSQFLMAIPLLMLYEISIIFSKFAKPSVKLGG